MSEFTIAIPWTPPRILSPNASRHVHWGTRTKARNAAKHAAYYAAVAARSRGLVPVEGALPYRIRIGWEKGRKRMDDDNAVASCKAAQDAICQALGIDDKRLRLTGVEQVRDPSGVGVTHFIFGTHDAPEGRDDDAA